VANASSLPRETTPTKGALGASSWKTGAKSKSPRLSSAGTSGRTGPSVVCTQRVHGTRICLTSTSGRQGGSPSTIWELSEAPAAMPGKYHTADTTPTASVTQPFTGYAHRTLFPGDLRGTRRRCVRPLARAAEFRPARSRCDRRLGRQRFARRFRRCPQQCGSLSPSGTWARPHCRGPSHRHA